MQCVCACMMEGKLTKWTAGTISSPQPRWELKIRRCRKQSILQMEGEKGRSFQTVFYRLFRSHVLTLTKHSIWRRKRWNVCFGAHLAGLWRMKVPLFWGKGNWFRCRLDEYIFKVYRVYLLTCLSLLSSECLSAPLSLSHGCGFGYAQ